MVNSFLELTNKGVPLKKKYINRKKRQLTPSIISFFPNDELIATNKGKLYFLSSEEGPMKIKFKGNQFSLIESESLFDLEQDYFKDNKDFIEDMKKSYLNKIKSKNDSMKDISSKFESSFQKENSIDLMVKNYFFPATKNIDIKEIIDNVEKYQDLNKKLEAGRPKDVNLNFKPSLLEFYLSRKSNSLPIIFTNNKAFFFDSRLTFLDGIHSLDKDYKKFLKAKVGERIKNSFDEYLKETINKDMSVINTKKQLESIVGSPHRDFGADKISNNEYILFKKVKEYGVEYENSFYIFPQTLVGVALSKNSSGYKLGDRGFLYKNPNYAHPYAEGAKGNDKRSICTAGNHGAILKQIDFSGSSKEGNAKLMKSAVRLIGRFENILKRGHNSSHLPAHGDSLEKSARKISEFEATRLRKGGMEFFKKIM